MFKISKQEIEVDGKKKILETGKYKKTKKGITLPDDLFKLKECEYSVSGGGYKRAGSEEE